MIVSALVPLPPDPRALSVVQQLSAGEVFVGRHDIAETLSRHNAGILILTGDSGLGKTRLLRAAFARHLPASAALTEFRGTSGSLQVTLLDALGQLMLDWQRKQSATSRLRMAVGRIAKRATTSTASQMGKVAGRLVLDYLRTRIGAEAVEIIEGIAKDLATPNDALLEQRIHAARDDDALAAFIAIADEVHDIVGNLVLFVDGVDRLTDDDYSAFIDLSDRLPKGVAIVGAMAVTNLAEETRARQAVRRGVARAEVSQLTVADVREWLDEVGVSTAFADQVHQLTSGYPVFIEMCVRLLQTGRGLDDIEVSESFKSLTEQSWTELTDNTQAAAQLMLGFDQAPPIDIITAVIGIDANAWVVMENRMREAKIFCAGGDGRFWFHSRRRQIIWTDILTSEQRRLIADRVAPVLASLATADDERPEVLVPLAALAVSATNFVEANPELSQVLDLPFDDLVTLYSALELLEPMGDEPAFLQTSQLLGYRRELFPVAGDGVSSVERLVAKDLLYVVADDNASIATTTIPSELAFRVLGGQFLRLMGKLPMTRAATAAFDIGLRPLLEPFKLAQYGIGSPKFADIIREFDHDAPLLLIAAELGVRRYYLVAAFHSQEDRDAAAERVRASSTGRVFDDEFVVVAVVSHASPVASDRLLVALGDVYDIGTGTLSSGRAPRIGPSGISALRAAKARSLIHEFARSRFSEVERLAANCNDSMALFVDERDSGCLEVEARTNAARVEAVEIPYQLTRGPMSFLNVTEHLNLQPEEWVSTLWHYSRPTEDPVIRELLRLRRNVLGYNTIPARYLLPRDEDRLREDIVTALRLRQQDIEALRALSLDMTTAPRDGVGRHLVWIYSGRDGWNLRGAPRFFATDLVIPANETSVDLWFAENPEMPWEDLPQWLRDHGLSDTQDANIQQHQGWASHVLGPLLGHSPQNVQIWPDAYLG
jgi:hypothetical protein